MFENWEFIFSSAEKKKLYEILTFLKEQKENGVEIVPSFSRIFSALQVNPDDVRVVICGQDPYHTPNVANGLAFAVNESAEIPPSLRNIFKELKNDLGEFKTDQTLLQWVRQGVLLLNNTLTVEVGKPNSHAHLDWFKITNRILKFVSEQNAPRVFILWGNFAREKKNILTANDKHLIIESSHPSPLSANRGGFFGTKPFSKANDFLIRHNINAIEW